MAQSETGMKETTLEEFSRDVLNETTNLLERVESFIGMHQPTQISPEKKEPVPAPDPIHAIRKNLVGIRETVVALRDSFNTWSKQIR